MPCRPSYNDKRLTNFNLYTIVYNITRSPNGFFTSFSEPWPSDSRLVRLKNVVDNAYLNYYSHLKKIPPPQIKNIQTQAFPTTSSRLSNNANAVSLMGVFYLFFPPMMLFTITINEIVKEKESKLKSYVNLYGLSLNGYWFSWIINSVMISLIVSSEIVIFGKYIFEYEIFINSNIFIIFNVFFLFCVTMQFFAMYLSCLVKTNQSSTTVIY